MVFMKGQLLVGSKPKISFLRRVVGLSLQYRMRRSDLEEFGVEPKLHCIEQGPAAL